MAKIRHNEFVFPGNKEGRSIARMVLLNLVNRLAPDVTVHGFRSTFRDWSAEATNFPREAAELALAHAVGDAVERAYARGDLLEKRRKLMEAWATYCGRVSSPATLVMLGARRVRPWREIIRARPGEGGRGLRFIDDDDIEAVLGPLPLGSIIASNSN